MTVDEIVRRIGERSRRLASGLPVSKAPLGSDFSLNGVVPAPATFRPASVLVPASAPICRFSATLMRGKIRRPSGDCAMLMRAIRCVGIAVMSTPSNTMRPVLARGLPKIDIISVDLPAPLAPISATISPGRMSISTPFSASILP